MRIRPVDVPLTAGLLGILLTASSVQAQTFAEEREWRPLRCRLGQKNVVMTDPHRDVNQARDERDIVGAADTPAAEASSDGEFLYLRIRLDAEPMPAGILKAHAWGVLIDTDGDTRTYEHLLSVNGVTKTVAHHLNTATTFLNSPADPPDEPALSSFPLERHARSVTAAGSTFGNDTDHHLEFALPWKNLYESGLLPTTPVHLWVATATNSTTLDGDLACFDNATGSGHSLSDADSRRTVFDAKSDSDGDGFTDAREFDEDTDPTRQESRPAGEPDAPILSGGGGCSASSAVPASWGVGALLLLACSVFRRRRSGPPSRLVCVAGGSHKEP